jgi:hypothetical protein
MRRHQAKYQNQIWAMDFQFDASAGSRRLNSRNVID